MEYSNVFLPSWAVSGIYKCISSRCGCQWNKVIYFFLVSLSVEYTNVFLPSDKKYYPVTVSGIFKRLSSQLGCQWNIQMYFFPVQCPCNSALGKLGLCKENGWELGKLPTATHSLSSLSRAAEFRN